LCSITIYVLKIEKYFFCMNNYTTNIEILSRKKAAAFLGICLTTLDRLNIPKTKIRHRVMYRRDVLDKWLVEQTEKGKKAEK